MTYALISLGANLGNSRRSINTAASMLVDAFEQDHVQLSSLLTSPPIGGPSGQDVFFNAVAEIKIDDEPAGSLHSVFMLWHALRAIESDLGRERRQRWEARRIDLDILTFGTLRLWTPHLKIPHPRMVTRSFAILPAAELRPHDHDPVSTLSLKQLADRLHYQYDPKTNRLGRLHDRPSNQIVLVCESVSLYQSLKEATSTRSMWNDVRVECFPANMSESQIANWFDRFTPQHIGLFFMAMQLADPMTIAWEDYSRVWARRLGFDASNESEPTLQIDCPKYLLNCSDLNWGIHEFEAAIAAMQCDIEFAEPSWSLAD